jgi:threonine/homoserine/homoserine lactone efflux protein
LIALPDLASLGLFVAAALVLLITPGPAVLYIVARSIDQGRRAGLVSMLGVHAGTLVHVAAAAAGLSALLAASAMAFSVVKYLGAAYLIFLGVRRLLDRTASVTSRRPERRHLRRAFLDGVVVNVLNPKTALFFLAFLPQFVMTARGDVGAQILGLGLLFVGLGVITDGLYAVGAGTGRPRTGCAGIRGS